MSKTAKLAKRLNMSDASAREFLFRVQQLEQGTAILDILQCLDQNSTVPISEMTPERVVALMQAAGGHKAMRASIRIAVNPSMKQPA
jgi:hypothetical protein